MRPLRIPSKLRVVSLAIALAPAASAQVQSAPNERRVSLGDALLAARLASPDLLVARARESVARADVGIAATYPNPAMAAGTNTRTAHLSGTLSLPLVVLGQRGASVEAARAEEATVRLDTEVGWSDLRQATERAFFALWLAEGVAMARAESATIEAALESAIVQRVQVGSAPEIDALRVHAERLRADAEVLGADAQIDVAASELARWMGLDDGGRLRTTGDVSAPDAPPTLQALLAQIDGSVAVRREHSDVLSAEARARRERALVRPAMSLDLGVDLFDPSLIPQEFPPNYRAQLTVELPLFNQRGAFIDRERAQADVSRARVRAARAHAVAELTAAYRTFEAGTARHRTLIDAVVPAAQAAARATEEAYALGRAPLVAVLDTERALVDARVSALDAQAARASAWADVEHAVGAP